MTKCVGVTDGCPGRSLAEWAVAAVGAERLVSMTGLREGGAPWLMRYESRPRLRQRRAARR